FAQRRELAEMGRAFDGAALKAQLLRGGVVMDRGVGVVSLRMQHLLGPPPRSGELAVGLRDLDIECFHRDVLPQGMSHRVLTQDNPRNQGKMHFRYAVTRQVGGCASMAKPVHAARKEAGSLQGPPYRERAGQESSWH